MWQRIPAPYAPFPDWSLLRGEEHFLYRRTDGPGGAVLAVGRDGEAGPQHWGYGHMTYRPMDVGEALPTRHRVPACFPEDLITRPRFVLEWGEMGAWLHAPQQHASEGLHFAKAFFGSRQVILPQTLTGWKPTTSREAYLASAERLMKAIQRGDLYEVNYCVEHTTGASGWDPFHAFPVLLERSNATYAAFYRRGSQFALSASPERFLRIEGRRVMGQPMKGTRPRASDPDMDRVLAMELAQDPKERAENIMAVDVMRHDLSRVAAPGTVRVEALCEVKSHARVHQMTSTISAVLADGLGPMDALTAAFPMASMTGAPKRSAMMFIDDVEDMPRGLYSGALGFFTPDGVADLSVVIRTVIHDASTGSTSLCAGSALTANCHPALEWEECMLKFRSVAELLRNAR